MHFSKRTSLSLLVVALTLSATFIAVAARAESTFLLQFGSYNTEAQAEQKWTDVKAKNADLVNKLTLHVAEVALPPDNTTMYRTQAGPISSHDEAANLCSTLQSRGVECYVVETALFTSEPMPSQALNDTQPTIVAPVSTLPAGEPAIPLPPSPVPPSPMTPSSVTMAPEAVAAAPAVTPPAPAAPASSTVLNLAAEHPAPAAAPAMAPAETAPQPLVAESISAPVAPEAPAAETQPPAKKPGFFSRLFGGSSAPAAPAAPTPVAAPTEPVAAAPIAPIAAPAAIAVAQASATPAPDATSISYVPAPPPPPIAAMPEPAGKEVAPDVILLPNSPNASPAQTQTDKPGFFGRLFGSNTPEAAPEPAVVTAPAPVAPLPATLAASQPVPAAAPVNVPAAPNVVGNVKVAEAIRVPVGSGEEHKAPRRLPPVHGLGGLPSAPMNKSVWAQLSYFNDENEAHSFYESFHAAYPQFADGVRVRITRPFMSSAGRVSLRVGPFAGTTDVNTICAAAAQRGVHCTLVREIGGSVASGSSPSISTNYRSNYDERVLASAAPAASSHAAVDELRPISTSYWVQLGTYRSQDDAWDKWNDLKDDHKKLLRHVGANVQTPAMSSANRALFRLRAGPFISEASANSLCSKLQDEGTSCLVLSDR